MTDTVLNVCFSLEGVDAFADHLRGCGVALLRYLIELCTTRSIKSKPERLRLRTHTAHCNVLRQTIYP